MPSFPAHIDEQLLTARLLAGDPAARQYLYDRYAAALYGVILQMVPERQKADEMLVRLFTYAFQHIQAFRSSGHYSLFAWLMKQAREISLRDTSPSMAPDDAAPDTRQLTLKNNHYIQRFAAALPEQSSQVFRLCYFKGLHTQAVARILGRDEAAVKQSLQIAMVEFRKYLQSNWS